MDDSVSNRNSANRGETSDSSKNQEADSCEEPLFSNTGANLEVLLLRVEKTL